MKELHETLGKREGANQSAQEPAGLYKRLVSIDVLALLDDRCRLKKILVNFETADTKWRAIFDTELKRMDEIKANQHVQRCQVSSDKAYWHASLKAEIERLKNEDTREENACTAAKQQQRFGEGAQQGARHTQPRDWERHSARDWKPIVLFFALYILPLGCVRTSLDIVHLCQRC
jgi:hypothetical protein